MCACEHVLPASRSRAGRAGPNRVSSTAHASLHRRDSSTRRPGPPTLARVASPRAPCRVRPTERTMSAERSPVAGEDPRIRGAAPCTHDADRPSAAGRQLTRAATVTASRGPPRESTCVDELADQRSDASPDAVPGASRYASGSARTAWLRDREPRDQERRGEGEIGKCRHDRARTHPIAPNQCVLPPAAGNTRARACSSCPSGKPPSGASASTTASRRRSSGSR